MYKFRNMSYLKKTLFYNALIAAICFTLILLGTVNIYKHNTLMILSEYISSMQNSSQSMINHSLDTVRYSSLNSFYSPDIKKLKSEHTLSNFEIITGIRALNALVSTSSFIHSAYVYNPQMNKVFTSNDGTIDLVDFNDKDSFNYNDSFIHSRQLDYSDKKEWVYTFTFFDSKNRNEQMVINIDADLLNHSLFDKSNDDDYIFIPAINKTFQSETNKNSVDISSMFPKFDKDNGYIRLSESRLLYYSTFESLDWYLIKEIDQSTILKSNNYIVYIGSLLFLALFFMISVLYFNISKRYHRPLEKIINEFDIVDSESETFKNSLDTRISDFKNQKELLKVNQRIDFYITTLSNSKIINCIPNGLAIDINSIIYIYAINNTEIHLPALNSEYDWIEYNNQLILFSNIPLEDVLISQNPSKPYKVFKSVAKDYQYMYSAYQNILTLIDSVPIFPNKYFLDDSDLPSNTTDLDEVASIESNYINSLIRLDLPSSYDHLNAWYRAVKDNSYSKILMFYIRLYSNIYFIITEELLEETIMTIDEFESFIQSTNRIDIVDAYIEAISIKYLKQRDREKKEKLLNFVDEVKKFVHENLNDLNLSSKSVADYFSLSPTYLNRQFKSQCSVSLSEYITQSRMEKAKKMLMETDLAIKEISLLCGIHNSSYFYTLFKKYYNCSPSQCRGV